MKVPHAEPARYEFACSTKLLLYIYSLLNSRAVTTWMVGWFVGGGCALCVYDSRIFIVGESGVKFGRFRRVIGRLVVGYRRRSSFRRRSCACVT